MGSHPSHHPPSLKMAAKEIWKAVAMADHFEKIQKLPDPVPGCPNFRRVPGYKVYCCGQPTVAGFRAALEKVCGTIYPKDGKIIWVNMRQEPNVYINGEPVCARPANKIGEEDELEFAKVLENRASDAEGKVKVVDINKVEKEVELKELITLSSVIEGLKEEFPPAPHEDPGVQLGLAHGGRLRHPGADPRRHHHQLPRHHQRPGGTLKSNHRLCRSLRLQGVPDLRLL